MSEDTWDEEFERVFSEIGEIKNTLTKLSEVVASLEKRMLLRTPGNQYCRLCGRGLTHGDTGRLNPPLSEAERKFHDANHGQPLPADRSKNLPGFSAAVNWDELEKEVERFNSAKR